MSRLTEKYVQDVALDFLKDSYNSKYKPEKIFYRTEVVTRYKKQRGRADGLIAFQKDGMIYTVSLEAKSHKTFDSLLAKSNDMALFLISFIVWIVSTFLILKFLIKFNLIIRILIALVIGTFIGILCLALLEDKALLKKHGIIEQVRKYPANEKWIAFSIDAYNFFRGYEEIDLKTRAKRYGIGILIVSKGRKVTVELHPKVGRRKSKVNFLKYYSIGNRIQNYLS